MTVPERRIEAASTADASEWIAVLGHELRSPIAAILGYQELLEEGMFGAMPDAALESIRRIGFSARHLLLLVEGVEHLGGLEDVPEAPTAISSSELCINAINVVRPDADTRGVTIDLVGDDIELRTMAGEATRALALALGAAIKVSPDTTLQLAGLDAEPPAIVIGGSMLDPARDAIAPEIPLTGAALRLELARAVARRAGGAIVLDPAGTLRLSLPRLPIDGAEHLP